MLALNLTTFDQTALETNVQKKQQIDLKSF